MKELELNIPTSWDEITLKMFDEIVRAEGNPYEKTVSILETLSGIDEKVLRELPAITLESSGLNKKLEFLTKEPIKRAPGEKLKLNGKNYNVGLYPAKWTAAQYLDYNTVLGSGEQKKLARIIACFAVPEGKKYGDYDYEAVVNELYEHLPVTIAMGFASFFQLQLHAFVKALSAYTEKKKKRLTRKQVNLLLKKPVRQIKASMSNGTHSS